MSRHPVSVGGRADAADYKQELLGRLGLQADAGDQEVESAHNGLVEFLELAPHEVKSWAATQTADIDEAFALLSGPEQDLVPPSAVAAMAQVGLESTPVPAPAAPAATSTPASPGAFAAFAGNKPLQKKLMWVLAPLLVVGVLVGVYLNGKTAAVPGISGAPTNQQTAAANGATPVDQAKLAPLMKKITANPKDTASLQAIGDLYFTAKDYKNALTFEQQILGVDPKNQGALLAAGAAQFNLGNTPAAKKQWLIAAGLYPKNAEVHYDLGFLYMSATPPDSASMQAEWKQVVAIDPNSDLAKTVATHLKSSTASPTASATPGAK